MINDQDLTIIGTISAMDYSSLIEKNSDFMMDPIHFGIAIVSDIFFEEIPENEITYNYSYQSNQDDIEDSKNYQIMRSLY